MKRLLLVLPALLGPSVASAQASAPDVIVGSWRISNAIPFACQALTWRDERTKFAFIEMADGEFRIVIESPEWDFGEDEKYGGAISWDGGTNWQAFDLQAGRFGNNGMLVFGDPSVKENFRKSHRFWLRVPGAELDREFSIDQADAVIGAFDECLAGIES